jgi:hypothetical protein
VNAIAVMGHNSRTAHRCGRSITQARINLADLGNSWTAVTQSPWLRVAIIDGAGKRAWTNPLWRDQVRNEQ